MSDVAILWLLRALRDGEYDAEEHTDKAVQSACRDGLVDLRNGALVINEYGVGYLKRSDAEEYDAHRDPRGDT